MTSLRTAERIFGTIWVLCAILGIAFWVVVMYVAYHFLSRWW